MNKLAGLLGLAIALAASGPALADGYGRKAAAPIPVPAPMPVPESFSYYLRGDLGWSFVGSDSFSESGAVIGLPPGVVLTGKSSNTDGVFIGTVGAGVYLSPRFRGDLTLDFRGEQSMDSTTTYTGGTGGPGTARDTVRLRGTIGLANLYWDLLPRGHFTPYVGAGIGFVYNDIARSYSDQPAGIVGSGSDNHVGLAGALMAGISFATDHRYVWDLSYRALYTDAGSITTVLSGTGGISTVDIGSQWEHQVRIGLRVNLW